MKALVTGNGRGLGAAIERELISKGWETYGTHLEGKRRHSLEVTGEIQDMFRKAGEIDALVNCAGVLDTEEFGNITMRGFTHVMYVNLLFPLLCAQEAVKKGVKVIVNIGSLYGETGSFGRKPVYAASKGGLHNATRSLARILAPAVRVVAVAPGIVPTGIHDSQGGVGKHGHGNSLLHRFGTPEEVAKLVRFVIEDGTYITGSVLECGGGR